MPPSGGDDDGDPPSEGSAQVNSDPDQEEEGDDRGMEDLDDFLGLGEEEELLADEPAASPQRPAARSGKIGPRTGAESSSSSGTGPSPKRPSISSLDNAKAQRRPRGNLPTAPVFDGDKKKNPKCFRQYVLKVDSYVEIAKNIIDDSEIGLRLHAALEGDAADYLEDIPAKTFGVKEGWKVLLRVLKEKFDERRMHKVGSAMKGFFKLDVAGKNLTMVEVADAMDKAARRCREAGLTIPDEVMVYFLFEHTGSSLERQANILLRTSGEYNWKKVKQAIELLYSTVQVRSGRDAPRDYRGGGKARGAHEAHWEYSSEWRLPDSAATEDQISNWLYDHDPAEMIAEQDLDGLPEDLAKALHSCMATHRENRQKLAKAVQARGFFVNSGKGKKGGKSFGKGSGKGKPKSQGKGYSKSSGAKARGGMSLDELKAVTVCADCGMKGHWRGDAACTAKKVNEASKTDADVDYQYDEDDWQEDWYGYPDYESESWQAERYGYEVTRSAQVTRRADKPTATKSTAKTTTGTTSDTVFDALVSDEAVRVARGVNKVRSKLAPVPEVSVSSVEEALRSDDFLASDAVTRRIKETHKPTMSRSSAPEAVERAFKHFGLDLVVSRDDDIREFLVDQESDKGTLDLEKLRRAFTVRRTDWVPMDLRGVLLSRRAPAEVEEGKDYLTIDTACENTVVGKTILNRIITRWHSRHGLVPKVEAENEFYCFGPGQPQVSRERVHLPVGLGGQPLVISTSVIDDSEMSEIPFLAGQDFLTLVQAVIDMGSRRVRFPALNDADAPALRDRTGHLVLELEDFPQGGWPTGLAAGKSSYAGVLFQGSFHRSAMQGHRHPEHSASQDKYTILDRASKQATQQATHRYEPSLDDLNINVEPFECSLPVDYWECAFGTGLHIRHHFRPRKALFGLQEAVDGPEARWLKADRVTLIDGVSEPLWDLWDSGTRPQEMPFSWTGKTVFFLADAAWPPQLPVAGKYVGISVKNAESREIFVSASSLVPLEPVKKVLQFDLSASGKRVDAPPSKRTGTFHIPQHLASGKSGSRQDALQDRLRDSASSGMATPGTPRDPLVRQDSGAGDRQQLREGNATPLSGSDGLRRGDDHRGTRTRPLRCPDESSSAESEGDQPGLPSGGPLVRAPGGCEQAARECQWSVPGLPPVRQGDEGLAPRLRGADHEAEDSHFPGLRHSSEARRQNSGGQRRQTTSQAAFNKHGVLNKIVRLLFVLGSVFYSSGIQRLPCDDLASLTGEIFGDRTFPYNDHTRAEASSSHEQGGGRPGDRVGHRHGDVRVQHGGMNGVRSGQRRRMQDRARKALESSRVARNLAEQMSAQAMRTKRGRVDLLEIFAGEAGVTARATSKWNMKAVQPIDLLYNFDLRSSTTRRWLLGKLDEWDPGLVVIGFPCTYWTAIQHLNYYHRPEELEELREAERPFLKFCRQVFLSQVKRKRHAIVENPSTSAAFLEPDIAYLRGRFYEVVTSLCAFGMVGRNGEPLLKKVRLLVSHELFIHYLARTCPGTHVHGEVQGGNSKLSAIYPRAFADAICRAYWAVQMSENFGTFLDYDLDVGTSRTAYYVKASEDEGEWRPLLNQALEILGRKVQSSLFLDPNTDLYRKISQLVPWDLHNVQLAYLPKAKRVRPGLERDHRLSAVLYNDDSIAVEQEELRNVQAPRERFVTPVRVAIFVLGHAPGEPGEAVPARSPSIQRMPTDTGEVVEDHEHRAMAELGLVRDDYSDEIWFVGPPLTNAQKKLAPFVAKAHRNLGHPRAEDLTRALAQNGKVDPEAVTLSRRMRCATCERTKRPLPPRPTSFKIVGAFNDKACLDLLHLRDAQQKPHWFLHVLEPNGSFNVFYPVHSRDPGHVLEVFTDIWMSWAGPPSRLWLDKDGAFGGDFLDRMTALGVEVDNPAAEAHWQAGEVETFNRAFKYVANKIIDEKQLSGDRDMKLLAAEVGAAMNDKVRTSGCSANQWVFGKSPRLPADLLSPDGRIEAIQGMSHDQELRLRAHIRADADGKLSEFRINEALRNAVLRMPRPPRHQYEPGDLVAGQASATRVVQSDRDWTTQR